MSSPQHTNRLIHEKSPYLLQHAHNPVDWFPWGEEAFQKARAEDKPIFLSIGYSTCHWCHVMERESFENESVAELLNRHFVSIKLDREERPDIDRVYMAFVQAATGSGGWPMSVFLTPDLKPFYGGTYFPPENRYGRPGFGYLVEQLAEAWRTKSDSLAETAARAVAQLAAEGEAGAGGDDLDAASLDQTFAYFQRTYDARHGGFGAAPKFPRPSVFQFLFRYHRRTGNAEALEMALHTLRAMAKGGMHDQLGGGFHRYSVDERWHVPHFEKMLYDQAQLAIAYLEAFQITGQRRYAGVAASIFSYVQRDLTHPEGGFYSAEDADSAADPARPAEKSEGAFYIWSEAEIRGALGEPAATWFIQRYGCRNAGNALEDPHSEFTGRNILFEAMSVEDLARRGQRDPEEVSAAFESSVKRLFELRSSRPRPHLDDKILTGWNAMMISAFARGARVFQTIDPVLSSSYLDSATRAASFLLSNLRELGTGELLRRWRDGAPAVPAFLDDYALTALAFIDLHEASFDGTHLDTALELARLAMERFEDRERGGFYASAAGASDLILRLKDDYDGAEPCGNSTMAMVLLRLAAYTGTPGLDKAAERVFSAFGRQLSGQGPALPAMLSAWMYHLSPKTRIVFAARARDAAFEALTGAAASRFLPEATLLAAIGAAPGEPLPGYLPEAAAPARAGREPSAFVCRDFVCLAPVSSPEDLAELLK